MWKSVASRVITIVILLFAYISLLSLTFSAYYCELSGRTSL